ncbi:hypothetical protein SISNIDRAFT_489611 [Sistotremastrum niveocremeum HHB9708]|uniref:DUF6535 domain-containing protein n=1 Tax=Sistotremastrum niveocremeum HHB9708 TaxID=1314777 RepID=A0A164PQV5_9AGAM|nr:hypothetical protein SISNIDRAFT_489611 [Sistotremastrum niveocremeum HHB9708]
MSAHPDPPDPHQHSTIDFIPITYAPPSILAAAADPFDTPMFNRLIRLIEEQNATSEAQREALEKQNMMLQAQNQVLEEQREVMKDMRRALDARHIQIKDPVDATLEIRPKEHAVQTTAAQPSQEPSRPVLVARDVSQDPHQQPPSPNPLTLSVTGAVSTSITQSGDLNHEKAEDVVTEVLSESAGPEVVINTGVEDASEPAPSDSNSSKGHVHDAIMILNETMKSIKETLLDHGSKLNVLIRDALKDDQPYDEKPVEDESTCTALFEIAMTRTKEQVDEWIKRMDVSLVFIALFSAVLTAFLIPAIQNLFPSSSSQSDSPPPLPDISLQNVCILHFLALILAILDAVLSVLGRQWMSKLTTRPEGSTYRERLLRHLAREALAKRWLRILVEGLHIILLASIGLFMTGLLYQLRNLAGSFDEAAPRLMITWKVGMSLSSIILAVVAAAAIHALFYEVSPFGGPFSKLLFKFVKLLSNFFSSLDTLETYHFCLHNSDNGPLWLSYLLVRWRVKFDTRDKKKLLCALMDLIAEASDPKLVERVVGSFSYVKWFKDGKRAADQLEKAENRLLATDTSVRVRETLKARAKQFIPYGKENWRRMGSGMTKELIQSFPAFQSWPEEFRNEFLSTSFQPGNANLRSLSVLPFEECIAQVLCSYNHRDEYHYEGKLENRGRIFHWAEKHCAILLQDGKVDDVTRILSSVDQLDLVKSIIQCPDSFYSSVIEIIVKDRKHEILRGINDFVKTIDQSKLGLWSLSQVFAVLASPPPTDIDLSPFIDYFSRHPYWHTWRGNSATIIAYLISFPLSRISDSTPVRRFLEQCVDTEFRSRHETSDETHDRARDLLAELNSLSFPPTSAIATNRPASPWDYLSHNLPLNNASQPDSLLSPSPASENIDTDAVLSPDSRREIPITTLQVHRPQPVRLSSVSEFNQPLASNSREAFDQSSALENADRED